LWIRACYCRLKGGRKGRKRKRTASRLVARRVDDLLEVREAPDAILVVSVIVIASIILLLTIVAIAIVAAKRSESEGDMGGALEACAVRDGLRASEAIGVESCQSLPLAGSFSLILKSNRVVSSRAIAALIIASLCLVVITFIAVIIVVVISRKGLESDGHIPLGHARLAELEGVFILALVPISSLVIAEARNATNDHAHGGALVNFETHQAHLALAAIVVSIVIVSCVVSIVIAIVAPIVAPIVIAIVAPIVAPIVTAIPIRQGCQY
jgi:hypothetical protein